MPVHVGILTAVCSGIVLASAPLARPQEATSANLPEHLETGEATPTPKLKKKKAERRPEIAAKASTEKPAPRVEQPPTPEEAVRPAAPVEKKHRVKRRTASSVQPQVASFPTPTSSLSAAQAMAVSAPLPEYPYQAKHANVTGSGVCLMIVDTASGKVTNAMMAQSTGNGILDKVTTETFRRWRFKPGTVSQVRVPITYE